MILSVRVEFQKLDHEAAHVTRVEKVSCFTVWHEDAEDAREPPVIPLRHLHLENVKSDCSQKVEHTKSHHEAPRR